MKIWPDIGRLHMLVEFERLGSLAAVAESLSYSSSAVSQQMTTLQKEVGAELVRKRGKALELTDQGRLMAQIAKHVLLELETARTAIAASSETIHGQLRVACLQTVTQVLLPETIVDLRKRFPDFSIELVQGESLESLESLVGGAVSVAIAERFDTFTDRVRTDLTSVELFTEPMSLITRVGALPLHAADATDEQSWREALSAADWVFEPLSSPSGQWALEWCRRQGFEPRVRYESGDLLSHLRLIERGLAFGFIPHIIAATLPRGIAMHPLDATQTRTVYLSTWTATADHPGVIELTRGLERAYRAHSNPPTNPA
ncbi:LysR family transcriptional regulator [Mycobacterium sp. 155]|uniref:LysR family transcriptional regulator n=1 Tax=Mycobacterium sp. 155 TaxID=1157943 RepID=UPI00037E79A3|nr:LysR family transcriptional regulator [Mycobacterium sp. 155]